MRKYQQLLLCVLSLLSVGILLFYKSENSRLKDVLQVVNFFGRNEASILLKLENDTRSENLHDFSIPLPTWQRIGKDFYLYSCFWNKKELVTGGEAICIGVGLQEAIINFKCSLNFNTTKKINGKFAFIRLHSSTGSLDENLGAKNHNNETFNVFHFLCKISRDFGQPLSITFTEVKSKISHDIMLKNLQLKETSKIIKSTEIKQAASKSLMTICLNLVPYTNNSYDESLNILSKSYLMQFFMHHQAIGVDEIIVYDSNRFPQTVRKMLSKSGLQISYLPYNFPYDVQSNKTYEIIKTDCLLRNMNSAQYTIILEPNQFFYTNTNLHLIDSVINGMKHYENHISCFEISTFAVCLDHRNKLLIDNTLYDPERKIHKVFIYRPTGAIQSINKIEQKCVSLLKSQIIAHNYVNCVNSKDVLYDWRNSIREDFMQYIQSVRNKISFLF